MKPHTPLTICVAAMLTAGTCAAMAQAAPAPAATVDSPATSAPVTAAPAPVAAAPAPVANAPAPVVTAQPAPAEALVLHFDQGSSMVKERDRAVLDQASHMYRDGHPVVMIVSGAADSVGSPEANLALSQQRASSVLRGLVARGIPAERFQLLAKGETDPAVPQQRGVAQPENRRVEIRWR